MSLDNGDILATGGTAPRSLRDWAAVIGGTPSVPLSATEKGNAARNLDKYISHLTPHPLGLKAQ